MPFRKLRTPPRSLQRLEGFGQVLVLLAADLHQKGVDQAQGGYQRVHEGGHIAAGLQCVVGDGGQGRGLAVRDGNGGAPRSRAKFMAWTVRLEYRGKLTPMTTSSAPTRSMVSKTSLAVLAATEITLSKIRLK